MKRHLFAAAALLAASASAWAAAPVVGTVASANADKTSFVVTAPDVKATIKVTPDTKFALNDGAADFAKAIAVGNEVHVILDDKDQAFIVIANTVPVKGTVKSAAADSFVVATPTGDVTVKVSKDTVFTLNRQTSTLAQTVAAGNTVTVNTGADGVASDVVGRPPRAGAGAAGTKMPLAPGSGRPPREKDDD